MRPLGPLPRSTRVPVGTGPGRRRRPCRRAGRRLAVTPSSSPGASTAHQPSAGHRARPAARAPATTPSGWRQPNERPASDARTPPAASATAATQAAWASSSGQARARRGCRRRRRGPGRTPPRGRPRRRGPRARDAPAREDAARGCRSAAAPAAATTTRARVTQARSGARRRRDRSGRRAGRVRGAGPSVGCRPRAGGR